MEILEKKMSALVYKQNKLMHPINQNFGCSKTTYFLNYILYSRSNRLHILRRMASSWRSPKQA